MASRPSAGKATSKKDGEDLTTILDQSQRADLTLLIADITDSMRYMLLQNFDAEAGLDKGYSREGMNEEEKLMATDPKSANVEAMDQQKRLKEEYEKDLSSMKMKTLKKYSLQAFDDWREKVLVRVGEVVNSRDTVKKQVQQLASSDVKPEASSMAGKIVKVPDQGSTVKFKDLYQPIKTPLTKLSMEHRNLILHSMLLLMLSLEHYNASSRVLLLLLTSSLKLPLRTLEQDEHATAKGLLEGVREMTAEEETKKKAEENKDSRKWKFGLATAAGAALIGVTGGLAAPLVAAGVGSVMGGIGLGATTAASYLGSVAGSTYLVGGLFGAYGGRMTGNMMDNYAKEVEDFEFLPVHTDKKTSEDEKVAAKQASDHHHKLRVAICISGWLTEKEEVLKPWRVLGTGAEVFALKYELEAMLHLGNAMKGFVESAAWGYAKKQVIAHTIFANLAAAMWPIHLLKAARVIDNPFNIAKHRSEKAGEILADALINKVQGERPVTLIGYSLGARVIYSCLKSLADRKAFGLVENAVLVGAPIPSDTSDWRMLRAVVSGRLVNVYSQNDYVLGFMYRTSSLQYGVAGLQAVHGLTGVENVDVSEEISGHLRYRYLMGSILKKIGFEDIDMQAVEQQKEALTKVEEEEQQKSLQAQEKEELRRKSNAGKEDEEEAAEHEASEIEKEVQANTQKSMLTRAMEYFYAPKGASTVNTEKAAKNVEKTVQAPSQADATADDTAEDVQQSGQSLVQKASSVLPDMPYRDKTAPEQSTKEAVQGKHDDNAQSTQSYASRVAGYLPSVPGFFGRSKPQAQDPTTSVQPTQKLTGVSHKPAKKLANTADDTHRPTTKNNLNLKDDPTLQAAKDATKKTAVTRQAAFPTANQRAGRSISIVDTIPQDIARTASETGKDVVSEVGSVKSQLPPTDQGKESNQSFSSHSASHLPSATRSVHTISEVPSTRKPPPKLGKEGNSNVRPPPPKLERKGSSQVEPAPSKKAQVTESDVKRRPPKLGPKTNGGI